MNSKEDLPGLNVAVADSEQIGINPTLVANRYGGRLQWRSSKDDLVERPMLVDETAQTTAW